MRVIVTGAGVLGAILAPAPAQAQSLGDVMKRAAERETKRQAERRTREAVQCVLGARDCIPRDQRQTPAPAVAAPAPARAASGGDGADAYLVTDASAAAAPVSTFVVPPIPGARIEKAEAGRQATYRRITGFRPGTIAYTDHTGIVSRAHYALPRGQSTAAMIAAWREPLRRQGMTIEWQCARRQECGSSSYHQLGAGFVAVNGINLGVAGDVQYFTGRLIRPGQPTVHVSIALNRNDGYVDVVESAP